MREFSKTVLPPLKPAEAVEHAEAVKYLLVGRALKKFGHGRYEVYCHDGVTRQCRIRGLLRKKGQVFIDINSMVVVSLRSALSDSDSENDIKKADVTEKAEDSDIIGVLSDKNIAQLRKTSINTQIFVDANSNEDGEDLFDRSEVLNEGENQEKQEKQEKHENEISLRDL
jgi:translation initiation factor IF-1